MCAFCAGYQPSENLSSLSLIHIFTGYGRADKEQVAYMVCMLLGLPSAPQPDDVTDALAICLCHGYNANDWGRGR